jgi:cyclopropane fatty-acyl-phospholipid synthase-like methyltransferase
MDVQEGWWKAFFSDLPLDVQVGGRTQTQSRAEAEMIAELLDLGPDQAVLDVPCGEGRIALELAEMGCTVTGVDITPQFLDAAQQAADTRGLNVLFVRRDMRDLEWEDLFDAALCWWGSFGYFDDEGNRAFLDAVSRALKPGGRFLLETHTLETLLPRYEPHAESEMGDRIIVQDRYFNHVTGRIQTEWTFKRDDRIVMRRQSSIRLYTYKQIVDRLWDAGFKSLQGYDTTTGEPFEFGSKRLSLVASK